MELVGYEDDEAGNFSGDTRSTRLQSCEVHRDILVYAMRYALGRMSYAPMIVVENIKRNIDFFTPHQIELLIKDIEELKNFGGYGTEYNKIVWAEFSDYLETKL